MRDFDVTEDEFVAAVRAATGGDRAVEEFLLWCLSGEDE